MHRGTAPRVPTPRPPGSLLCPDGCELIEALSWPDYAYLLGQYLGDGYIARGPREVYRLIVTCCAAYPDIVEECAAAVHAVLPTNRVGRRTGSGAIDLSCYSKHLPCLFPQHGPGPKHLRPIKLAPWQIEVALEAHPDRLIRGLVHSDGCRSINRVRSGAGKTYSYARYLFSNRSDDIRAIFGQGCDRLGIDWRPMNRFIISVARRDSVAVLDEIVGPKS